MDKQQQKEREREKIRCQDTHFKGNVKDCPLGRRKIKPDRNLEIQEEMKNNRKGDYVSKSKYIVYAHVYVCVCVVTKLRPGQEAPFPGP